MVVTLSGIAIVLSEEQFLNVFAAIVVIFLLRITSVSAEQSWKRLFPKDVTLSGITTDLRLVQVLNTAGPIDVTLPGILIYSSDVQFLNATFPIDVTPSGRVTETREVQP